MLPAHYKPEHAADYHYAPDATALLAEAEAYRAAHSIRPAATDARNVHLLLIDVQKDFCFPQGTLYVGGRDGQGAINDNRRIAEFIYRQLGQLTRITATLDTHLAQQIFSPSFWTDAHGKSLQAHQVLTTQDLRSGRVKPNPNLARWVSSTQLTEEAIHYCESLERAGKYQLYLWPPHCLLGSPGHSLAGVVHAAQLFHAYARETQTWFELKGFDPLTESYSALGPEVPLGVTGTPLGKPNQRLIDSLFDSDVLIVAGQASSHCVKSTLEDLTELAKTKGPRWAERVYLLTDCMSPVAVPDGRGGFVADFTEQAEAALERLAATGMHRVHSTTPLTDWPGLVVF